MNAEDALAEVFGGAGAPAKEMDGVAVLNELFVVSKTDVELGNASAEELKHASMVTTRNTRSEMLKVEKTALGNTEIVRALEAFEGAGPLVGFIAEHNRPLNNLLVTVKEEVVKLRAEGFEKPLSSSFKLAIPHEELQFMDDPCSIGIQADEDQEATTLNPENPVVPVLRALMAMDGTEKSNSTWLSGCLEWFEAGMLINTFLVTVDRSRAVSTDIGCVSGGALKALASVMPKDGEDSPFNLEAVRKSIETDPRAKLLMGGFLTLNAVMVTGVMGMLQPMLGPMGPKMWESVASSLQGAVSGIKLYPKNREAAEKLFGISFETDQSMYNEDERVIRFKLLYVLLCMIMAGNREFSPEGLKMSPKHAEFLLLSIAWAASAPKATDDATHKRNFAASAMKAVNSVSSVQSAGCLLVGIMASEKTAPPTVCVIKEEDMCIVDWMRTLYRVASCLNGAAVAKTRESEMTVVTGIWSVFREAVLDPQSRTTGLSIPGKALTAAMREGTELTPKEIAGKWAMNMETMGQGNLFLVEMMTQYIFDAAVMVDPRKNKIVMRIEDAKKKASDALEKEEQKKAKAAATEAKRAEQALAKEKKDEEAAERKRKRDEQRAVKEQEAKDEQEKKMRAVQVAREAREAGKKATGGRKAA